MIMRLTRIDTNKGNKVDGGYLHTVFENTTINGKVSIEQIASQKFTMILNEREWIEGFTKDPAAFIKELSAPQTTEVPQ
jgi:hypothetical protein